MIDWCPTSNPGAAPHGVKLVFPPHRERLHQDQEVGSNQFKPVDTTYYGLYLTNLNRLKTDTDNSSEPAVEPQTKHCWEGHSKNMTQQTKLNQ